MADRDWGPSTRAIHAGLPPAEPGAPLLPGPAFAAPYHLIGETDSAPYGYARDGNPTWTHLEAALGALEGGEAVAFASGMAAVSAVVLGRLKPGDKLVAPGDGYPGIRKLAEERLRPAGIRVELVPTDTEAIVAAAADAALVWIESPSNPRLDLCDIAAIADAVHAAGGLLGVDNTVATPLGQRPLELGADFSMCAGTKSLAGHSDLLLGSVAVRDGALADGLRAWRSQIGATPSPFEAWLAHRSLATLELRLSRQSQNALAIATMLEERDDVTGVRHPSADDLAFRQMTHFGPLVGFELAGEAAAQAFLARAELVVEATSFGGVHTTAERRGRWGTDAVSGGFVRLSAGCEDVADLLADLGQALDAP